MKREIITTEFYTYYPDKIKVIDIVDFKKFIYFINLNQKKLKKNFNKTFIYYFKLYVNSICYIHYINDKYSFASIYEHIEKLTKNNNVVEHIITDDIIIDYIKDGMKNLQINIENKNKNMYMVQKNYIWNNSNLNKYFECDKEKIKDYKRTIINKNISEKKSLKKTNDIIEVINNNKNMNKSELMNSLKSVASKNKIYSVLKDNDIKLNSKSKTYIMIENKLNNFFNGYIDYDKFNKIITYDILAENMNISKRTIVRFFNEYPDFKNKLKDVNKKIKKYGNIK